MAIRRGLLSPCWLLLAFLATGAVNVSCGGGGGGGGSSSSLPRDPDYPPLVHEIYLPVNDQEDCLLSITGVNGDFYWITGERDADGIPQRVTDMVLTWGPDEQARVVFDELQRVVRVTLPDDTEVHLAYVDGQVEVTVITGKDEMETALATDPFLGSGKTREGEVLLPFDVSTALCEAIHGTPGVQVWRGDVQVCDEDVEPIVLIAAEDVDTGEVRQVRATLRRSGVDPRSWSYYHSVNITGDYEAWRRFCVCTKFVTGGLAIGGIVSGGVNLATSIVGFVDVLHQVVTKFDEDGVVASCELLMNVLFSGTGDLVREAGDWLVEGGYACSSQRFDNLQKLYKKEIRIFAVDRKLQEVRDFLPVTESQVLPPFDFTGRCCELSQSVWVVHEPREPHYSEVVRVRARFIPPAEGCQIRFKVLFKDLPVSRDYTVDATTNAAGEATIEVRGDASLRGVRTAVQVEGGPQKDYEGSAPGVNSVYWDWGF